MWRMLLKRIKLGSRSPKAVRTAKIVDVLGASDEKNVGAFMPMSLLAGSPARLCLAMLQK